MAEKLSERDQQVLGMLERVIYQRLETGGGEPWSECFGEAADLDGHDGELIGVYKLSHFARVKTKPASVSLQTVRAK